ncbi:hypothetical protein PR048_029779, partial [Dryococelus australis]
MKKYSGSLAQLAVLVMMTMCMKSLDNPQLILIRGEANYVTVLSQVNPDLLPNKGSVKAGKVNDARALLRKQFGDDWESMENLVYYCRTLS